MPAIRDRRPTVLALHGFTLGGAMFNGLAAMVDAAWITPDLPGHGGRTGADTNWTAAVAEVTSLVTASNPDVVVGYSMGGRLAVAAALASPPLPLIAISTGVGIEDAQRRSARVASDEELAVRLERHGLEPFLATWEKNELVGGHSELRAVRRRNSASGLAAALRGMGQGVQPYLGDRLSELAGATAWIAGEMDTKYIAIARESAERSGGTMITAPGARHNVVADAPAAVAAAIRAVLSRRSA